MFTVKMLCVLTFLLLCFDIFVTNNLFVLGSEPLTGESTFKLKLAQDQAAELLAKKGKPAPLQKFREQTDTTTTNLGISLPPEYANDTIKEDHHTYYNSTFYVNPKEGQLYWKDVDKFPKEQVITHAMLSDSYRQATTIELTFDFPFYGTLIRNITIATGGFLYMGDYLHNWIAATQYIAPLMANFDTSVSGNSTIKYADNGSLFIVQWDNILIQDRLDDGAFTFQVTLFKNGDIAFAYKEIPFPIVDIPDGKHPVKIGISDAYILERAVFFVRRKTIYEYHRIDMLKKSISNNTAIYFTALTTCLDFKDCVSCMDADKDLECAWCEPVQRCSDGVDRQRQSWVVNGCTVLSVDKCPAHGAIPSGDTSSTVFPDISTNSTFRSTAATTSLSSSFNNKAFDPRLLTTASEVYTIPNGDEETTENEITAPFVQGHTKVKTDHQISIGAIITIVAFIAILIGVSFWMFYAYKFPQSSSGQFLIKYRPSQWNFKKEESNVNADSFNM